LIEAFPAAQLRHWCLPCIGYNGKGNEAQSQRGIIIEGIKRHGLHLENDDERVCADSADALDAVICMFAAAAVAKGKLNGELGSASAAEGQIAIHK
jgi:Protein of unknown function (DUF429)